MMTLRSARSCLATAALLLSALPAQATAGRFDINGIWLNPKGSVAVRTETCGRLLCGKIVWVNAEAAADAQESGIGNPIGTEVLRDYRGGGNGVWHGVVFVPDMGRSFRSTITALGPNQLRISGCLIGNFICKSQIWRRR